MEKTYFWKNRQFFDVTFDLKIDPKHKTIRFTGIPDHFAKFRSFDQKSKQSFSVVDFKSADVQCQWRNSRVKFWNIEKSSILKKIGRIWVRILKTQLTFKKFGKFLTPFFCMENTCDIFGTLLRLFGRWLIVHMVDKNTEYPNKFWL